MQSTQKVLVVANRTADSPELIATLRGRQSRSQSSFTLLVPAVPRGLSWAADMKAGWNEAIERAQAASQRLRLAGIELDEVVVGDPDPFAATGDVLHGAGFDEVIVSTLPRSVSRWLRLGLPDRLRRAFSVKVTQLTAHPPGRIGRGREPEPVGVGS